LVFDGDVVVAESIIVSFESWAEAKLYEKNLFKIEAHFLGS